MRFLRQGARISDISLARLPHVGPMHHLNLTILRHTPARQRGQRIKIRPLERVQAIHRSRCRRCCCHHATPRSTAPPVLTLASIVSLEVSSAKLSWTIHPDVGLSTPELLMPSTTPAGAPQ